MVYHIIQLDNQTPTDGIQYTTIYVCFHRLHMFASLSYLMVSENDINIVCILAKNIYVFPNTGFLPGFNVSPILKERKNQNKIIIIIDFSTTRTLIQYVSHRI